tara:strand:+ start:148 stop:312 length:165 start_codon:yes stop_codon:yes gene_type:complete
MHRIERNILHHANKRKQARKHLMYKQELSNGIIKRTFLNADGSENHTIYLKSKL